MQQKTINCTYYFFLVMNLQTYEWNVEKSKISPHHRHERCGDFQIFPHMSCGEIWHFLTGQMWRIFRFFHICHVIFLHMTNFSPQLSLLILATNIRYEYILIDQYWVSSNVWWLEDLFMKLNPANVREGSGKKSIKVRSFAKQVAGGESGRIVKKQTVFV